MEYSQFMKNLCSFVSEINDPLKEIGLKNDERLSAIGLNFPRFSPIKQIYKDFKELGRAVILSERIVKLSKCKRLIDITSTLNPDPATNDTPYNEYVFLMNILADRTDFGNHIRVSRTFADDLYVYDKKHKTSYAKVSADIIVNYVSLIAETDGVISDRVICYISDFKNDLYLSTGRKEWDYNYKNKYKYKHKNPYKIDVESELHEAIDLPPIKNEEQSDNHKINKIDVERLRSLIAPQTLRRTKEDVADECLVELDGLVGLDSVKSEINSIMNLLKGNAMRKETQELFMSDKIPCTKCKALILPCTAERTGGICMRCAPSRYASPKPDPLLPDLL